MSDHKCHRTHCPGLMWCVKPVCQVAMDSMPIEERDSEYLWEMGFVNFARERVRNPVADYDYDDDDEPDVDEIDEYEDRRRRRLPSVASTEGLSCD